MKESIVFLIKPSSSKCNLKCSYCFYHDISVNREIKDYGFMSEKTTHNIIKKALDFVGNGFVSFAFQGGEPTLIGVDFYIYFVNTVNRLNKKNAKVNYSLQTNGVNIDDDFLKFFFDNDFLIGLSLDGTKEVHNLNRYDHLKRGTHHNVLKTISKFDKYNIKYNILTVVTSNVVRKINSIYNYYKKNNFQFLQFIPCLDEISEVRGLKNYSLTPKLYSKFLQELFDLWEQDFYQNNYISIRFFDNIFSILLGNEPESCDMKGICSIQNVVEANGDIYPCDFYVLDEFKLGNINHDSIQEIIFSDRAKKFIVESTNINKECKSCKWLHLCRSGCRRHKESIDTKVDSLNYFCESYKSFYSNNIQRLIKVIDYTKTMRYTK